MEPYVPGEQPHGGRSYVKLNTNECPFPPAPGVAEAVSAAAKGLQLYCDPEATALSAALARHCGAEPSQIVVGNGSDEVLNYAFMAFCDEARPAVFPDISYGFYEVWAKVNGVPFNKQPLRDDLTVDLAAYPQGPCAVFLANPNAPTGRALSMDEIGAFAASHPETLVVVDEAYVDFGAESCIPLAVRRDNVLVVQTFSKSRSLAGARFGFCVGSEELVSDIRAMKYSTNPYNVNAMTQAAALEALRDADYMRKNCDEVVRMREWTAHRVRELGFECAESQTNFLFMRHPLAKGGELYAALKERGILVRHFEKPRIDEYIRVTIGTESQMRAFVEAVEAVLCECR